MCRHVLGYASGAVFFAVPRPIGVFTLLWKIAHVYHEVDPGGGFWRRGTERALESNLMFDPNLCHQCYILVQVPH